MNTFTVGAAGIAAGIVGLAIIGITHDPDDPPATPIEIEFILDSAAWVQWKPTTGPGVAGYRVHWGTQTGVYTEVIDVGLRSWCRIPTTGTVYVALTLYNSQGVSGPFSGELVMADRTPTIRIHIQPGTTPGTDHNGERVPWTVPTEFSPDLLTWTDLDEFWVPASLKAAFYRQKPGFIPPYDQ